MRIAVASGKGGTGKTTVAVALARVLEDCTFIDCDVEAPNAHIFLKPEIEKTEPATIVVPEVDSKKCDGCGECSRACRFNSIVALGTTVVVFPEICHGCGGCVIACEPGAITEGRREIGTIEHGRSETIDFHHALLKIGEPMSPPLIRALKSSALDDLDREADVILDCPPGTSCPMIEAVGGADFCLLVTEPTPFGMHDLELAALAVRQMGIPSAVVVNRADVDSAAIRYFCRDRDLPIVLEIPHSREIAEGYARGEDILGAVSGLAEDMRAMAARISGRRAA